MANIVAAPYTCRCCAAADVENGLPPPIPFSVALELDADDEAGETVVAVVEVAKPESVPVYVEGVPVCISRLSSLVLEAVDVSSPLELGDSVAVLTYVCSNAFVEEIVLLLILSSAEVVEVTVVNVLLSLNCPLASWLTDDCGEGCIVVVDVWLIVDGVVVDFGMIEVVEDVSTGCTASVVVPAEEVLCSVGVGAGSVARVAGVVVSTDEVLSAIEVETVSVVITIIVIGSVDGVSCGRGVGATCVLMSACVVGCTKLGVAWIRIDAVAIMPIAAASASSRS